MLTSSQCIPYSIDHAVSAVGFHVPNGEPEIVTTTTTSTSCRTQRKSDKNYTGGCAYSNETLIDGLCCVVKSTTTTNIVDDKDAYFLVANSWGADWAGEGGLFKLALEAGNGPCNMNYYGAFWVNGTSI